jgi:hypothetical protein
MDKKTNENISRRAFEAGVVRRNIFITIIAAAILFRVILLLIDDDAYLRIAFTDWALNVVSAVALGLGIIIVYRQRFKGLHGKTYLAFTIGLSLWFAAEIIQTYYEMGPVEEIPYPSPADALWLAGYVPFAYHLLKTYSFFSRAIPPYYIFLVTILAALAFSFVIDATLDAFAESEETDLIMIAVHIAYPALDALLIVPASLVLLVLRKGLITSIPWIMLATSLLVVAVADSAFGYLVATSPDDALKGFEIFYFVGYLCMAGALFWYNRFFIFDKTRATRIWQEENS